MKVFKCGSQTNLLPPQVEQKQQSLMQIRLAVVFGRGRGDALGVFLFLNWKFVLCEILHIPLVFT